MKNTLIAICLLLTVALIVSAMQSEKKQVKLTRENRKLHIQKDSLLEEKVEYEKKFLQLMQQFDTVTKKKALDSIIIFIPKDKKKGKPVAFKKNEVFN